MQHDDVYEIVDPALQPERKQPAKPKKPPFGRPTRLLRSSTSPTGARGGQPRVAASLSLWLSGAGQFLHGQWKMGTLYLVALIFGISLHYFLYVSWVDLSAFANSFDVDEATLLLGVATVDFFLVIVLLSGIHNAYWIGTLLMDSRDITAPHPLVAGAASVLVPGWGQIANGQIGKAMVFLFILFAELITLGVSWVLSEPIGRLLMNGWEPRRTLMVGLPLAMCGLLAWCLSLYDAILVARFRRGYS